MGKIKNKTKKEEVLWSNLCLLIVSLCRLKKVKYLQNEYWALFSTFSVGEYLFIWFRFFLFFFFFLLGTLLNTLKKHNKKKPQTNTQKKHCLAFHSWRIFHLPLLNWEFTSQNRMYNICSSLNNNLETSQQ